MVPQPQLIFEHLAGQLVDQHYNPRNIFSSDGDTKIWSVPAYEPIPCGVLCEMRPDGMLQVARSGPLAGISIYQPNTHDNVAYAPNTMVPVLRSGICYALFWGISSPDSTLSARFWPTFGYLTHDVDPGNTATPKLYLSRPTIVPAEHLCIVDINL